MIVSGVPSVVVVVVVVVAGVVVVVVVRRVVLKGRIGGESRGAAVEARISFVFCKASLRLSGLTKSVREIWGNGSKGIGEKVGPVGITGGLEDSGIVTVEASVLDTQDEGSPKEGVGEAILKD